MFIFQSAALADISKKLPATDVVGHMVSGCNEQLKITAEEVRWSVGSLIASTDRGKRFGITAENFNFPKLTPKESSIAADIVGGIGEDFFNIVREKFSKRFENNGDGLEKFMSLLKEYMSVSIISLLKVTNFDMEKEAELHIGLQGDILTICKSSCVQFDVMKAFQEAQDQLMGKLTDKNVQFGSSGDQVRPWVKSSVKTGIDETPSGVNMRFGSSAYAKLSDMAHKIADYCIKVVIPALFPAIVADKAPVSGGTSPFIRAAARENAARRDYELGQKPTREIIEKENKKKWQEIHDT